MHTIMELRPPTGSAKNAPIYILCPSKVSVTFSALSASIIAINCCIPVQNASLIAEIPFNWTIANTRYGIISVVGGLKKKKTRNV